MSESPISYKGRQGGPSGQGPLQNPTVTQSQAPGHQPIDVEQEELLSKQQQLSAQQKAALAQGAAKLAEDAASMAGKAAEMARQAAEMAARAADLPWDGPSAPAAQPFFNMAPGYGSSNRTLIPPQPPQQPQHIDQPMENYKSQFPVTEGPNKRTNSRASGQEAGGSSSQPAAAIAPNPVPQPDGTGYQNPLMVPEQQNTKKPLAGGAEGQQQSGEGSGSRPAPAVAPNPAVRASQRSPGSLEDYQYQLMLLEQANKKRDQEMARQQQRRGEGSGGGGA
jgi:hypothetical protein